MQSATTTDRSAASSDPSAPSEGPAAAGPSDGSFLDAMSALAGGVCVVTTAGQDGRPAGYTSTAVMSLSRSPQLLAIGVRRESRTLGALRGSRRFALNVLHARAENVSRRFADPLADRFHDLAWTADPDGLPLLTAHSSHILTCAVIEEVPAGDHRLLIAAVRRVLPGAGGPGALVHLGRRYHALGTGPAA